ncbi:MAG: hypothetical protein D6808_08105 [Candidatus Dadabacteria bacterium]|nr:MAG: hypothetical protein D6808_08105 [Candidatus Dadabacteria bacterium]
MEESDNNPRIVLLAALGVILFSLLSTLPWIWSKPFYTRGEPREAVVAQEILKAGEVILPKRYGGDVPTKPPLSHWLVALVSFWRGEVTEGLSRLPSVLLSALVAGALSIFVAKRLGVGTAFLASVILITSFEWHRASVTARVDMAFSSFLTFSLIFLFIAYERRKFSSLASLFLALSVLGKGPVGVVLPAIIWVFFLALRRSCIRFSSKFIAAHFVPSLAIAFVWYFLAWQRGGDEFLDIVFRENIGRFLGDMYHGTAPHSHSVWYLYGSFFLGLLPYSLVLVVDLKRLLGIVRRGKWQIRLKGVLDLEPLVVYSIVIVLSFLLFFSFPASKRSVYLLGAYPWAALLLGSYLLYLYRSYPFAVKSFGKVVLSLVAFAYLLLLFISFGLTEGLSSLLPPRQSFEFNYYAGVWRNLTSHLQPLDILLLMLPLVPLLVFFLRRMETKARLCLSIASFYLFLCFSEGVLVPAFAKSLSSKGFSKRLKGVLDKRLPLFSYGNEFYGINFYLGNSLSRLPRKLPSNAFYVLVLDSKISKLRGIIGERGYTVLLRSEHGITKPHYIVDLIMVSPVTMQPS